MDMMLRNWKKSVMLLKSLAEHSITLHYLHHNSTGLKALLPAINAIDPDTASINVTIQRPSNDQDSSHPFTTKGLLDTGATGLWVTREMIERAGLLDKMIPVAEDVGPFSSFTGEKYIPKHQIRLTWYPNNQSSHVRETKFLIIDRECPYDLIFGREYLAELVNLGRAVLSIHREDGGFWQSKKSKQTREDEDRRIAEIERINQEADTRKKQYQHNIREQEWAVRNSRKQGLYGGGEYFHSH